LSGKYLSQNFRTIVIAIMTRQRNFAYGHIKIFYEHNTNFANQFPKSFSKAFSSTNAAAHILFRINEIAT